MAAALRPVDEALADMLARAPAPPAVERVALIDAPGRVLAVDQVSTIAVPAFDNSAMDGYAIRFRDLDPDAGSTALRVTQRIAAGALGAALQPGTAARIFTGAPLPPGADTVVMQEDAALVDGAIGVAAPVRPGQHVRRAGQDIAEGGVVVAAGRCLKPQDIGVLASVGITHVPVYRCLKVAVMSTGDELVEPGQPLQPGQIYNSNRYLLTALLRALGCEVIDGGIVADSLANTCEQLQRLAEQADVIVSSGGVSVGEEDHVKAAVETLGELALWKLNIKPGKPVAFGHIAASRASVPFIGLPGNPSSVFVTYAIVARPYLTACQGRSGGDSAPNSLQVAAGFEWTRAGSRQEYLRARVERASQGPVVTLYPNQSSGVLLSTSWANALVVLPPNTRVSRGDPVTVLMLSELV